MTEADRMIATHRKAVDAYHRERRFAAIVQSVVSYALNKYGDIDSDHAAHAAYDIAMMTSAMLLQTIYEDDAEIRNLKAIADQYRAIAEKALLTTQPPMFIPAGGPITEAEQSGKEG